MHRLIILAIASLVVALSPGNASAVPISSGQTFRIDFSLTPQFPGSFDVAFFGPEFSDDPLGPFESLTFKFYNSADQLLAQRTFDIGNLELPTFWTGVDFIQPTLDPTGYVLLTDVIGSVNLVGFGLIYMGEGTTSPITLTFPIPEPNSLLLFGAGLVGALLCAAAAGVSRRSSS